ncbi:MAG TPA: CpsB/CapC family capsule biosynthesis tyrosine phosphatase [Thermoanaerobaculia bacterium]|nr:CpsB/CapC family capsule biosynthesis tyrosine phosphatase [Thermoanaerobaculia bacterium]
MTHPRQQTDAVGFVDLHAHLLPGVDDGPATLEESVAMLAMAHRGGTRAMAATPHMFSPHWLNEDVLAIRDAYARLVESLGRLGEYAEHAFLPELTLHLGAENYVSEEFLCALRAGRVLPLGEGRWLLVELPPELPLAAALGAVDQVLDAGFLPLVAHVERVRGVRRDPSGAAALVERGARLQVNVQSLDGWRYALPRRTVDALLEGGLVSVVASDAHDCAGRPPTLERAWERLARTFSPADARRWLHANAAAMLQPESPAQGTPSSLEPTADIT